MPRVVPPHRIRIRRQPGPEPRSISVFGVLRKAVFLAPNRLQLLGVNSSRRRTYNTRTRRRPACSDGTRAAANKPGNNGTDLPAFRLLRPRLNPTTARQQPDPTFELGPSPSFHPVSRPSGYSTTGWEPEARQALDMRVYAAS